MNPWRITQNSYELHVMPADSRCRTQHCKPAYWHPSNWSGALES